ncbi:transposase [Corynebacterium diphtheriae]|nr:transposase [Corynebacterium diphtheriae]CAB0528702.1 transposase [Corynebacterium diphtheriae]CAB0913605.1 transposase [Corynebacterium diphtheriae]CAB0965238.1 transposase [Corynebacterium diphtheriae]
MQPSGNAIVIEAEPINECPKCGQPRVLRDHVIRSLVDLPIVGYPIRIYVRLPRYRCTNKCCLQKIFHAGLACAPDNSTSTTSTGSRSSVLMSITGRTTDHHDKDGNVILPAQLLDVVPGRNTDVLRIWLNNQNEVS